MLRITSIAVASLILMAGCGSSKPSDQNAKPAAPAAAPENVNTDIDVGQAEHVSTAYWQAVARGDAKAACALIINPDIGVPGCDGVSAKLRAMGRKVTSTLPPTYEVTKTVGEIHLLVIRPGLVGVGLTVAKSHGALKINGGIFGR